ncbi:MAG TPA: prolyl oligopeptidase family serine peptidase [Gemmatimonadaceae bacterium]|nr:prolyl oligopeptidase family serine peptidase [Gemmatimonadaceae bacterium]
MSSQRTLFSLAALPLLLAVRLPAQTLPAGLSYPLATRGSQVDDYHGTRVADPYRWLEDTDSPETRAWVEAENRVTFGYLATIPERAAIKNRLTQVWNYPKYSAPGKAGDKLFFFENSGLLNQSILYVKDGNHPARVLLDPNTLSADGTVALSVATESPNGRLLGYSVSRSGSDWQEVRVRDVETGRDMRDTLKWVKFSGISWTRDNKGFFYSGYEAPAGGNTLTDANRNQRLYYHRLGTPQSADPVIFDRKDKPNWLYDAEVTDDGTFAIITIYEGTDVRTRLYYIFLDNPKKPVINAPVVRLIDRLDAEYQFVHNAGDYFLVRTDLGAPKGRLVQIDINNPQPNRWVTVLPENRDALQSVNIAGEKIVAMYLQDAHSSLRLYGMPNLSDPRRSRGTSGPGGRLEGPSGQERARAAGSDPRTISAPGYPFLGEIPLPGIGSVSQIRAKPKDNDLFYSFVSYLYPRSVFKYDMKRRTNEVYKAPKLTIDLTQFETKQLFFKSKDGTRVPMFVTMKKGLALDGTNPTILYGYGGFNISETPGFSPANLVWLEMGGIYAVANIRGGGEYGKEWHEGGMLDKKQNVFDDFIAAAEYLIQEKYTSTPKLAITGGSNGGLLVGAVMAQRPELFGAALPAVGVMDMLRFHKFTIGGAWTSDYGSPDDPKQFQVLRAYSPLHNLKPGTKYPATMITTADHDDRVVPGHSFKFAATLQAAQGGTAPVLIRIETKAGHGAGKPTTKQIEEAADKFAFLVKNLKMTVQLP